MSEQEQSLLLAIYLAGLTYQKVCVDQTVNVLHHTRVRDICNTIGNYKQNLYYIEKWTRKGWYSYGVTLDLGWLTDEGEKVAREQSEREERDIHRLFLELEPHYSETNRKLATQ